MINPLFEIEALDKGNQIVDLINGSPHGHLDGVRPGGSRRVGYCQLLLEPEGGSEFGVVGDVVCVLRVSVSLGFSYSSRQLG